MTLDIECPIFADRRRVDPQGCIDDLVSQTTRQGKAIHDLTEENKRLTAEIEYLRAGKARLFEDPPF